MLVCRSFLFGGSLRVEGPTAVLVFFLSKRYTLRNMAKAEERDTRRTNACCTEHNTVEEGGQLKTVKQLVRGEMFL